MRHLVTVLHAAASRPGTRVCHVVERLGYGGAETLIHKLAAGMRNTRHAPLVCCLETGPLAAEFARDGIHVECLGLARPPISNAWRFAVFVNRAVQGLRAVVARHDVGILHGHLQDAIVWSAVVGRLEGTAVVGTYHGLGIMPTDRATLDPRNLLRRGLYRLAARASDRTIAVSPAVRDLLCSTFGFPEHRTVLLLNGVDTEAFAEKADDGRIRQELGLTGRRVIACVGRLIPNKGQLDLLDAFDQVHRRFPDAALLLVGDGPAREALVARANALGISEHVVLTQHRRDVADLLAIVEVFAVPSFSEGISLALLEAMAAARPVVATAIPGNLEVLGAHDGGYGRLVPPGNAHAMAEATCAMLEDPAGARVMARRAQVHARERFDLSATVQATARLYDLVLEERRARTDRS